MNTNMLRIVIIFLSVLILCPSVSAENIVKPSNVDKDSLAFLIATQNGKVDVVTRYISMGQSLEVKDDYGRTPLHIAIEFGHTEIIRILIDAGADTEARTGRALQTYFGWTPLMFAAHWGNSEAIRLLTSAGADLNATEQGSRYPHSVLAIAAVEGNYLSAQQLIKLGANVNSTSEDRSFTPIFLASRHNHVELVELLINNGASVNEGTKDSYTPLHAAAISGNMRIAELLINNGAKIDSKSTGDSSPGETPLHVAAFTDQVDLARLLVKHNANINSTTEYGHTPLRRAIDAGNLSMAELLLEWKADVNIKDTNELSVLHIVAQSDMVSLAGKLIDLSSDINARDKYSKFTPLDYAQDGNPEMIKIFEAAGGICTSC